MNDIIYKIEEQLDVINVSEYSYKGVKLCYDDLSFEVTRRCNLKCEHCMRGEPEDLDMNTNIIKKVLDQVCSVRRVFLTGGEPFLVPDIIEYLVDYIIENQIDVYKISMVTNGTIIDDRAKRIIDKLNQFTIYSMERYKDLETCGAHRATISISDDEFHDNDKEIALNTFAQYSNNFFKLDLYNVEQYQEEVLGKKIKTSEGESIFLARTGRAKELLRPTICKNACYRLEIENEIVKNIEITAIGNVIIPYSVSFFKEDILNMGNIFDKDISCLISDWQWKNPLDKQEVNYYMAIKSGLIPDDGYIEYLEEKKENFIRLHNEYPYLSYELINYAIDFYYDLITNGKYVDLLKVLVSDVSYLKEIPIEDKINFLNTLSERNRIEKERVLKRL